MLKRIEYENWNWHENCGRPRYAAVIYAILSDNRCVFTGITPAESIRTSTINAAEAVITAICKQEDVAPSDYTFYDLQTSHGYNGRHFEEGRFAFDHIVFKIKGEEISDIAWRPERCPQDVLEMFVDYLDPNPVQSVGSTPFDVLQRQHAAPNN